MADCMAEKLERPDRLRLGLVPWRSTFDLEAKELLLLLSIQEPTLSQEPVLR